MKSAESVVPRAIALVLLLGSLSMLVPLAFAVIALAHGAAIPPIRWLLPLALLAAGSVLTWLLSRKQIPLQLFLLAFALWLAAAGAYWFSALR